MKYIYTIGLLFISSACFAQHYTLRDTTRLQDSLTKYTRIADRYTRCLNWRKFEDAYDKWGYWAVKLDSLKTCKCQEMDRTHGFYDEKN